MTALAAAFIWPVRVYYEDTDSAGVVYYANYLRFMERARSEWLRDLGFEQDRLMSEDGLIFAVSDIRLSYRRPAHFNDQLQVSVTPRRFGAASIVFDQAVVRYPDQQMLCEGQVRVACLDRQSMKPRRIPKNYLVEMKRGS